MPQWTSAQAHMFKPTRWCPVVWTRSTRRWAPNCTSLVHLRWRHLTSGDRRTPWIWTGVGCSGTPKDTLLDCPLSLLPILHTHSKVACLGKECFINKEIQKLSNFLFLLMYLCIYILYAPTSPSLNEFIFLNDVGIPNPAYSFLNTPTQLTPPLHR